MRKKIKYLSLLLLIFGITLTSLAYYSDYASRDNTFDNSLNDDGTSNLGGINIELTEPAWDAFKVSLGEKGLYLKPGATYPKDPTVTLKEDSVDAYVFMAVSHNLYSEKDGNSLIKTIVPESTVWKDVTGDVNSNKRVYMYVGVKANTQNYIANTPLKVELEPLFEKVKAVTTFDSVDMKKNVEYNIKVEAYAHQATVEDFSENTVESLQDIAIDAALISFGLK